MGNNLEDRFDKNENYIMRRIAGETLLVPIAGDLADLKRVIHLNDTAAFIWDMLSSATTLEDISYGLHEVFEVSLDKARADVLRTIEALMQDVLITKVESKG